MLKKNEKTDNFKYPMQLVQSFKKKNEEEERAEGSGRGRRGREVKGKKNRKEKGKKTLKIPKLVDISFFRLNAPLENSRIFNYNKIPAETSLCLWISNMTLARAPPKSHRQNFISFSNTETRRSSKDVYKRQKEGREQDSPDWGQILRVTNGTWESKLQCRCLFRDYISEAEHEMIMNTSSFSIL